MRILVTGITGQVGSATVARLTQARLAEPGSIVAADRAMLDLSRPDEIAGKLDALRPDVIINPAAYTAVDRAEDERDLAFRVNAAGPEVLAQWAAGHRVPLFHLSTDYVFDGSGVTPWRETDVTGPLGVYGASKLAGEHAVQAAGGAHLIVRTSWVYAASGTNFLRTIARVARERPELRVVDDQIGSPTSAAFIAEALARILAAHGGNLGAAFAAAGHCIHLAAGGETSWCGFATAIVEGLKRRGVAVATREVVPIPTKDYPTKAVRPLNSRLNLSRLREVYGIVPPSWDALLEAELDRLVESDA